jgi:hypothetical protein
LLYDSRRKGNYWVQAFSTVWQEDVAVLIDRSISNLHEEIYKMKFSMTKMAAGLVLAGFAVAANAASVTSMNITSGTFAMDDPTTAQAFTYINGTSTNLVGGYLGDSLATVTATAANPEDIASFIFFGKPVHTYTALTNYGDLNTAAGTAAGGGPVPTADISGGVMTIDLSSWWANWNNSDFNMGSTATGSVVALGGGNYSYDISWSATVVGGSFDGSTGYWTLQGTAAAVPEASTYGMMLAGLGLVGGMVARRRKLVA